MQQVARPSPERRGVHPVLRQTRHPRIEPRNERATACYQGRIAGSRQATTVTVNYLEQAVEDILADRQVAITDTEPYGCTIIW